MTKAQRKPNIFKVLSIAVFAMLICVFFMVGCGSAKNSTSEDTEYTTNPVQVYGVRFKDGVKQSDVNRIKDSYDLDYHEESENQSRQIDTDAEEYVEEEYERQIETEDSSDFLSAEEKAADNKLIKFVELYMQGKIDEYGNEIKKSNSQNQGITVLPNEEPQSEKTIDNTADEQSNDSPVYDMYILPGATAPKVFATALNPGTVQSIQNDQLDNNDIKNDDLENIVEEENISDGLLETPIEELDNSDMGIDCWLDAMTLAEQAKEIIMLARLIYGEARNIPNRAHWAGVCWCALNRLDTGKYGDTLQDVLTKTNKDSKKRADQQFTGYSRTKPSYDDFKSGRYGAILKVAADVYKAWVWEQNNPQEDYSPRRTLEEDFLYYWGDETYNYFVRTAEERRNKDKTNAWNWTLPKDGNPYDRELKEKIHSIQINESITSEEITLMAKQVWHKARGLKTTKEKAAVVWCILNRLESPLYEDCIKGVLIHPLQFSDINTPGSLPDSSYAEIVRDVLERWYREGDGESNVGRVLPKSYIYFHGTEDESENLFYNNPYQKHKWRWELEDPYTSD